MADRYDLLRYPVRLRSGTVADGAVSVDEGATPGPRQQRRTLAVVVAILAVGAAFYHHFGFVVTLGVIWVTITLLLALGPGNEAVETECRAVPAGDRQRVVAAHRRAIRGQRRRRLVGIALFAALAVVVALLAGPPEGYVTVGGSSCCSATAHWPSRGLDSGCSPPNSSARTSPDRSPRRRP